MNYLTTLFAVDGGLGNLLCDPDNCLSYVLVLLNILSVFYLIFSSYWRMTKSLKVVGYVWSAIIVCATVAIVAMHTCIFTLLCAVFSGLSLIAILSGVFNNGYHYNDEDKENKTTVVNKKGCYVIFRTNDGKFVFGLYTKNKKEIGASIYKYDTLEQAKAAVEACREYGAFVEIEDSTGNWILSVKHPKLKIFARNSAYVIEYALKEGLSILRTAAIADNGAAVKHAQLVKECLTSVDTYYAGKELKDGSLYLQSAGEMGILNESASPVTAIEKEDETPVVAAAPAVAAAAAPVYAPAAAPVAAAPVMTKAPEFAPAYKAECAPKSADGLTLYESYELMTPCTIEVCKQYLADHMFAKYGKDVYVSRKYGYTESGLAYADTYSTLSGRSLNCFAMSYDKIDCGILLLVRSDAAYIAELAKTHNKVNKSASPKSKTKDWYSIVIDETYSNTEVEEILAHAKAYADANK